MKAYDGVEIRVHVVLTLALVGGEWSASRPGRFIWGEKSPRYPLDRGLVGPRTRILPLIGLGHRPLPVAIPNIASRLSAAPITGKYYKNGLCEDINTHFNPEDEGNLYLRNINTTQIHTDPKSTVVIRNEPLSKLEIGN
jgi:hypothetical protein